MANAALRIPLGNADRGQKLAAAKSIAQKLARIPHDGNVAVVPAQAMCGRKPGREPHACFGPVVYLLPDEAQLLAAAARQTYAVAAWATAQASPQHELGPAWVVAPPTTKGSRKRKAASDNGKKATSDDDDDGEDLDATAAEDAAEMIGAENDVYAEDDGLDANDDFSARPMDQ